MEKLSIIVPVYKDIYTHKYTSGILNNFYIQIQKYYQTSIYNVTRKYKDSISMKRYLCKTS